MGWSRRNRNRNSPSYSVLVMALPVPCPLPAHRMPKRRAGDVHELSPRVGLRRLSSRRPISPAYWCRWNNDPVRLPISARRRREKNDWAWLVSAPLMDAIL